MPQSSIKRTWHQRHLQRNYNHVPSIGHRISGSVCCLWAFERIVCQPGKTTSHTGLEYDCRSCFSGFWLAFLLSSRCHQNQVTNLSWRNLQKLEGYPWWWNCRLLSGNFKKTRLERFLRRIIPLSHQRSLLWRHRYRGIRKISGNAVGLPYSSLIYL